MKTFRLALFLTCTITLLIPGCGYKRDNPFDPKTEFYQSGGGGETITETLTGDVKMEFVYIKPGKFTMGSPDSEEGRSANEGPQHEVTITQGFYLGKYEVTQAQWQAVMGSNPSDYTGDNRPVEKVSWDDVQAFIQKLNQTAGSERYRLPTEAEWEYACRAGSTTRWSFGDDEGELGEYAWYSGNNSPSDTKEVGKRKPNPWGLYDMHGNVGEWCTDWDGSYSSSAQVDPAGPSSGSARVFRGGAFNINARYVRSAYRYGGAPSLHSDWVGFRLVRRVN